MARARRQDQVELNFDGLTDAVTNLVGTLILLVVLVMSITRDAQEQTAAGSGATEAANQAAAELLARVEVLRAQVRRVREELVKLEAEAQQWIDRAGQVPPPPAPAEGAGAAPLRRVASLFVGGLPRGLAGAGTGWLATLWLARDSPSATSRAPQAADLLRERLAETRREVQVAQEQVKLLREKLLALARDLAAAPPPPPAKEPPEVSFRPPLEQVSQKPAVFFVCENGRVSILVDLETLLARIEAAGQSRGERTLPLNVGDFDLRGTVFPASEVRLRALRRAGAEGETAAQAALPGSRWQRFLQEHSPRKYNVQFNVYPDSHDIFRQVRAVAWQAGFEVGWHPQASGSTVVLSPGDTRTQ